MIDEQLSPKREEPNVREAFGGTDANAQNGAGNDPLASAIDRLKTTQLAARTDLKVSRHLFRGIPSYVVHDPISFQSHRFSQDDYKVLSRLNSDETLAETYAQLLQSGTIEDDERGFYEFVLNLQMRGLLDLPILDGARLYQRHKKRQQSAKKISLMKLLFIKIPLFNPNGFLDRTMHLAKPLFSKGFFLFFCVMLASAIGLMLTHWEQFYAPLANILATRNLVILFFVMTALKFWHELGHAYACKLFGGAVPDMGAFFMVGMPMAYVDVSASWGFANRRSRIMVALGGMYFELIAASIAMFVWAFTGEGLVNSTAHFVVLMASLMTILFNANPLMRYDGYYVLSDLTGIPNLRGRSTQYSSSLVKSLFLGLPNNVQNKSTREMAWLLFYGIAAVIYQYWLILVISFMVASQYFLVGIVIGLMFTGGSILVPLKNCFTYLWFSPETQPVRQRSVAVSGLIMAGIAALCTVIPIPGGVIAKGQLSHESVQSVRLPFDCYVNKCLVEPGEQVAVDQVIIQVDNPEIRDAMQLASAQKQATKQARIASFDGETANQKAMMLQEQQADRQLKFASTNISKLQVKSELNGTVLSCVMPQAIGSYVSEGTELARVGTGRRIVRVLCSAQQISSMHPKLGDSVSIRLNTTVGAKQSGKITRIEPAGETQIKMLGLTQMAGGEILLDPQTEETTHPYFTVEVSFDEETAQGIPENTSASVRFGRRFESIGSYAFKHLRMFSNKLFAK